MPHLVTHEIHELLNSITLPESSSSRFKLNRLGSLLTGAAYALRDLPSAADIQEFRLALHTCISANPALAYKIKFTVLILLTVNSTLNQMPGLLDLYAEILSSDPGLMNEFDDQWPSLVVAAAAYEQLEILRLLKQHNAPMQAVIPANLTNLGDGFDPLAWVTAGETAMHTYLRTLRYCNIFTIREFSIERSVPIINILLNKNYTPERIQKFVRFALSLPDEWFSHCLDAEKASPGMLAFLAPGVINKRAKDDDRVNTTPVSLLNFLDACGDGGVPRKIYGFIRPCY